MCIRNRKTVSIEYSLANADSILKTTNVSFIGINSIFTYIYWIHLEALKWFFNLVQTIYFQKTANASKIFDAIIMGQWYAIIKNRILKHKWIGYSEWSKTKHWPILKLSIVLSLHFRTINTLTLTCWNFRSLGKKKYYLIIASVLTHVPVEHVYAMHMAYIIMTTFCVNKWRNEFVFVIGHRVWQMDSHRAYTVVKIHHHSLKTVRFHLDSWFILSFIT